MIVYEYLKDCDKFVFPFQIKEKEKVREIITYKDNKEGRKLRKFHESLLLKLEKLPTSNYSFAYKKRTATKHAFKPHLRSSFFIKLDIKSFFESITEEKFFDITKDIIKKINIDALRSCFYKGHLSLGYVTSPKISDLYLYNFDKEIELYLKKFKQLHYSRYSDDILISSEYTDFGQLHTFLSYIVEKLNNYGLTLNEKKIREFDLSEETIKVSKKRFGFNFYPSVTFLGLNLVRRDKKTVITVSKSFIIKTLDLIDRAQSLKLTINQKDLSEDELIKSMKTYKYLKSNICSRVGYLKYNSKESYNKFLNKYFNKYNKKWSSKCL